MIEHTSGNILFAPAQAIVNPVNCAGVMGKGLALQFRRTFADNFYAYAKACKDGRVVTGKMFVFNAGKYIIINFPTKQHWKESSKLDYIVNGLQDLVANVRFFGIESIAIPPLGCGLGGLDWEAVRPLIEQVFADLASVHVLLYEPI